MLFDLEKDDPIEGAQPDVCIIGAGAAGILLAVELSKAGRRVVLLESGGLEDEARTQELYGSEVTGQPHAGIHAGRFRIYGGATTRWGGQILELFEHDFERRPWIAGSGWPFPKSRLTSYYERAIALEGLGRVTREDAEVWRELGLKTPDLGPGIAPYFSRWCPKPNFVSLHGDFLRRHAELQVWLHANACALLLAQDGATIRGVVAKTLSGRQATFTAGRYVLCLGGIESSRFLLQPREGSPPPWQRNGLLGRHFQDHIDIGGADLVDLHPKHFSACFDNVFSRGFKYQPRFRLAREVQEKEKTLNVGGTICFIAPENNALAVIKRAEKNLLRGRWREIDPKEPALILRHLPTLFQQAIRYKLQRRAYNPPTSQARLGISCEQDPLGESRITLSEARDALGLRRARLAWRVSDLELRTIRVFAQHVRTAFEERKLARVVLDPQILDENPEGLRVQATDANHHMGGVRMAASSAEGIVDLDLKIHGTANAYVCSSAVFPTSGFSNPTHTLMALALRLADHLKALPAAQPTALAVTT